jgi:hypothetical protein
MFIVELESGVWLAPWHGDPGRTVVKKNARVYTSKKGANIALGISRRFRDFNNARVISINYSAMPEQQDITAGSQAKITPKCRLCVNNNKCNSVYNTIDCFNNYTSRISKEGLWN